MPFVLGKSSRAAGYSLSGYDRVSSTNTEAMALARSGAKDLHWIAALEQTQGRGRRGRNWESVHGNLAASLYISLEEGVAEPGMLGFVAGVALMRAIGSVAPNARQGLKLKWPNDILYNGAKLVGILLEAEKLPSGKLAVVIGMGVNVVAAPSDLPYAATSIAQIDPSVSAAELFTALGDKWVDCLAVWDGGNGNAAILLEWRENAAKIGQSIQVKLSDETFEGVFEAIDDSGRLCLRLDDGSCKLVTSGDVYFAFGSDADRNV